MRLHKIKPLYILFFMIIMLYVTPSNAASPWPMFMHDARHTGRSEYTIPDQIALMWESDVASQEITGMSISVDGDTIYAASADHYLYAVDASDGSVTWQYQAEHEFVGTPAVDENGNIYIGSKDDYLYCLFWDGKLKWKEKLDSDVTSSPVLSDSGFVVVCTDDYLYAYDSAGTSLWMYDQCGSYSTPAISDDGTIYMAGSGDLHAIDENGNLTWVADLTQAEYSSPAIGDDGVIYCPEGHNSSSPGAINAIDSDGSILWSYALGDMPYLSNPATGPDGTIYIGCDDDYLYAIDPDGSLKWRYLMDNSMNGSSFAVDATGNVLTIAQSANSSLVALNSQGQLKWSVYPDFEFSSQLPIIGIDGVVFVSTWGGEILAIGSGDQENIEMNGSINESGDESDDESGGSGCFLIVSGSEDMSAPEMTVLVLGGVTLLMGIARRIKKFT
mgnify:CR=1 FL=1